METLLALALILFVGLVLLVAIIRLMASVGGEILTGINRAFESPAARDARLRHEAARMEFSRQLHRRDPEH